MSTFTLTGAGVQALSSGVAALHITINAPGATTGTGYANPPDTYGAAYLRAGDASAFWEPYPVVGGPQWMPLPQGATRLGYALGDAASITVTEVFGSSPLAFPLASLPDVSVGGVADAQVLAWSAAASRWVPSTPASGGGGGVGDHSVNAFHNATVTIPSGTFTLLALNSTRFDTDGFHSTTVNNGRLTIPAGLAGKYLVQAQVAWGSTSASGFRDLEIQLNGTTTIAQVQVTSISGGGEYVQAVSRLWQFAVGDYVQIGVAQNGGSGNTINFDASKSPEFSLIKLT